MPKKRKKAPKINIKPPASKGRPELRQILESYLGEVSDKTWQRIRNQYLMIDNEFKVEEYKLAVKGYGLKRLLCPSEPISRPDAELFGLIADRLDFVFYDGITGSKFLEFCQECFKRAPEWRWFYNRGLRKQDPLTRQQALEILAAIIRSDLFKQPKPAHEIPKVRTLTDRVTDVFEHFAA